MNGSLTIAFGLLLACGGGPAGDDGGMDDAGDAALGLRPYVVFTASELERLQRILSDTDPGTLGVSTAEIADRLRERSLSRPIDYADFPTEEPAAFWDQKSLSDRLALDVQYAGISLYAFGDDLHVDEIHRALLRVAGWDRWSERDLPNAAILKAMAWGYDWFYDRFTEPERETLRRAMVDIGVARIVEYAECRDAARSPMCDGASPNHMAANAAALGYAALVLPDEPGAATWLELAIERMEHSLGAAGGDDGGAVEGVNYGNVLGILGLDFLRDLRLSGGRDLAAESQWLQHYPRFLAYAFGPGGLYVNFNDSDLSMNSSASVLLWLAAEYAGTEEGRLAQALGRDLLLRGDYFAPLGLLQLRNDTDTMERAELPLAAEFPSVGQLYVRSGWGDDDMLFASRSQGPGPDGNRAHTHFDAGSFVLSYGGDQLLTDPGYGAQSFLIGQVESPGAACPGVDFAYLNELTVHASGHNTLLFDSAITQWTLVDDGVVRTVAPDPDRPGFYVEMEIADAYRRTGEPDTRVFSSVRRRILGRLPHALLIHDQAVSIDPADPHQMQVMFHSRWKDGDRVGPQPLISVTGNEARIELVDGTHTLRVFSLGSTAAALASITHPTVPCAGDFLVGQTASAPDVHAFHLLVPGDGVEPTVTDLSDGIVVGARIEQGADNVTLLLSATGSEILFPERGLGVGLIEWHVGTDRGSVRIPAE